MAEAIASVDRALEVLIYLDRQGGELGVTKIAEDLGICKSTAFRTLATLERRGFVWKNRSNDKYALGSRLMTLGKTVERQMGFVDIARPFARKLCGAYQEPVTVSVLEEDPNGAFRAVVVLREAGEGNAPGVGLLEGESGECHCTAVGKCLLAFSGRTDLGAYFTRSLRAYTERTITSPEELMAELELIRTRGYAANREEMRPGFTCLAAPILGRDGKARAALSLASPPRQMHGDEEKTRIEAVRRTAREIADKL